MRKQRKRVGGRCVRLSPCVSGSMRRSRTCCMTCWSKASGAMVLPVAFLLLHCISRQHSRQCTCPDSHTRVCGYQARFVAGAFGIRGRRSHPTVPTVSTALSCHWTSTPPPASGCDCSCSVSVCLSVCLSVFLSICLPVSVSVSVPVLCLCARPRVGVATLTPSNV